MRKFVQMHLRNPFSEYEFNSDGFNFTEQTKIF